MNHETTELLSQILQQEGLSQSGIKRYRFLSGGCINNAVRAETAEGDFCIKYNPAAPLDMFQTEQQGLELLYQAGGLRVPKPLGIGTVQGHAYFVMDYIDQGAPRKDYWEAFGRGLAALHQNRADTFGAGFDNYIGSLPQYNDRYPRWVDFFREMRLQKQVDLARRQGHFVDHWQDRFEVLYQKLPDLMPEEPPALIHGDLWSGNIMRSEAGAPAVLDPAVYYANREIELAFTQLFGGFDRDFYAAYHEAYPLQPGFDQRVDLYNLYSLLVHLNIFGPSYKRAVEGVLKRYGA